MEKKQYLKTIEEYIDYYSKDVSFNEYSRVIPEREMSEKEISIVKEIHEKLPILCKEYLNNNNNDSQQLVEYARELLFKKYNPNILGEILSNGVYDFLMLLDEFPFFKGESE
ncbi:MAG: hypothetical protein AB9915_02545 [Candidatus Dojkabacteria bacterium]